MLIILLLLCFLIKKSKADHIYYVSDGGRHSRNQGHQQQKTGTFVQEEKSILARQDTNNIGLEDSFV